MAVRFDNVIGRILIDEEACQRDIGYALEAISMLERANTRLWALRSDSEGTFVGRTGDRFRAALNTAVRKNSGEIDKLEELIRVIQATVARYRNADTSLAEKFRGR